MRAFLIALSVVLVVALVAQVLWWRKLLSFGASEPCSEKAVFDSGSLTRLNVQEFAFNKSNLVSELVVFGAEHWLCPNQVSKGCTLFSELSGGRVVHVYSDRSVDKKQFSRSADVTLAWLVEPPSTLPETYRVLEDPTHWEVFDAVLTFDQSLLAHKGKFYYFPSFGSYVPEQKWGVFSAKTQLVGFIASSKRFAPGHEFRHSLVPIAKKHGVQVFGEIVGSRIDDKYETLNRFRYEICVENVGRNYYVSEKLFDPVFSGIVPIYYGAPDVLSLFQGFNASGILLFSSIAQLESILQHVVSESDYNSRVDALRQNAALFKKLMGRGVVSRLKNLFL